MGREKLSRLVQGVNALPKFNRPDGTYPQKQSIVKMHPFTIGNCKSLFFKGFLQLLFNRYAVNTKTSLPQLLDFCNCLTKNKNFQVHRKHPGKETSILLAQCASKMDKVSNQK